MRPIRILVPLLAFVSAGLVGCATSQVTPAAVMGLAVADKSKSDWALHIAILDVGQADAITMVTPDGKACLIDAGANASAATSISRFLSSRDENGVGPIDSVELAFATHYDEDHIGGFAPLAASGIKLKALADQGPSLKRHGAPIYGKFLSAVGDKSDTGSAGIRSRATEGQLWTLGPASIRCVSVRGDTAGTAYDLDLDPSRKNIDENPGSVALLITLGEFEFYSAGDQTSAEWKPEPDVEIGVVNSGALGRTGPDIDVLKVNHHGSDTSTGTTFVKALRPEVAVISSRFNRKDYLPKMVSVMQLAKNGAKVLITGDGYNPDTGTFTDSIATEVDDHYVPPKGTVFNGVGTVHIFVSAGGLSYRVKAAGFDETFSAKDADNR